MSQLLIRTPNSPDSQVFAYRSRITGDRTSFYPQQGAVTICDEQTGKVRTLSRRDFLVLGKTLEDMMKKMDYPDEKADMRGLLACMAIVARNAAAAPDPFASSTDPAVLARAMGAQASRLVHHPEFGTMLRVDE